MPTQLLPDEERGTGTVRRHVPTAEAVCGRVAIKVFDAGEVKQAHGATDPCGHFFIQPCPTEGGMACAAQLVGTVCMAQLVHLVPFVAVVEAVESGAVVAFVPRFVEGDEGACGEGRSAAGHKPCASGVDAVGFRRDLRRCRQDRSAKKDECQCFYPQMTQMTQMNDFAAMFRRCA
ncbi:MAG: hypothetical protein IPI95_02235 [Flavobacteriales bacterium]|nr:hypothetical protein [Flavobacteriales bacterium]